MGVMGQNLALNIESKGFSVAGFDLDPGKIRDAAAKCAGKNMVVAHTLPDFVKSLATPRMIILLVPAGTRSRPAIVTVGRKFDLNKNFVREMR